VANTEDDPRLSRRAATELLSALAVQRGGASLYQPVQVSVEQVTANWHVHFEEGVLEDVVAVQLVDSL